MEKTGKDDSTGFGMIDMGQLLTGTQVVPESWYRTTIPAAPLVTSVVPRDSGLFVTWQTPAWNGGAPIKRYGVHVWRYTVADGIPSYDYVKATEASNTARGLLVPGLVNGYAYVVAAYARNNDDEGQWSVLTPPTRVLVPKIGTVTVGPGAARVTWTAPANVDGSPVARYVVDAYAGSTKVKSVRLSASAREARISGLVNGRAHTFVVWAEGTNGVRVPSKRSVSVTPVDKPGAPRIGTPAAANDAARVYWAAPYDNGGAAVSAYVVKVYSGTRGIKSVTVSGTARSVLVTGLANKGYYAFTVTAKNRVGLGPASTRSGTVRTT
jgi:titin